MRKRIRTNEELKDMYKRPSLVNEVKAQRLRWARYERLTDNIGEDVNVLGVRVWKEFALAKDSWKRVVEAARRPTKGCDATRWIR